MQLFIIKRRFKMVSKFIFKKRNGEFAPVGIFLGTVIDGELRIGHSLCSAEDDFDFDYAVALASIRTLLPDACPPSIVERRKEFVKLCIANLENFTYKEEENFIVEVG
jgi:hypothetical protein